MSGDEAALGIRILAFSLVATCGSLACRRQLQTAARSGERVTSQVSSSVERDTMTPRSDTASACACSVIEKTEPIAH